MDKELETSDVGEGQFVFEEVLQASGNSAILISGGVRDGLAVGQQAENPFGEIEDSHSEEKVVVSSPSNRRAKTYRGPRTALLKAQKSLSNFRLAPGASGGKPGVPHEAKSAY